MILAEFSTRGQERFRGLTVSGHAEFARYGEDIVCAAVTSAVQMTANGISEVLKVPASVVVEENRIVLVLPQNSTEEAENYLKSLWIHLTILQEEYPDHILVTTLAEV